MRGPLVDENGGVEEGEDHGEDGVRLLELEGAPGEVCGSAADEVLRALVAALRGRHGHPGVTRPPRRATLGA